MAKSKHRVLTPKKDGQRRLLALDGGGIRGVLTLGILEKVEADLRRSLKAGSGFRLNQYFDFIGGTSTGAIIAAGLSKGLSVKELVDFYVETGPQMFQKERLRKRFWQKFKSDPLKKKLQNVLGRSTKLGSNQLKTLLLLVLRNATTDSPWPLTNNPLAKYNDPSRNDSNLELPLWQLVRASTAAPTYFPPETVTVGPREFVFVDGGVTPYNNPAFLMYRIATSVPFHLEWEAEEDSMMIVSVGTGNAPVLGPDSLDPQRSLLGIAQAIAPEMMSGMAYDQDINCRAVGRCTFGSMLDREVGNMVPPQPLSKPLGRRFLYARYDPDITQEGLKALGLPKISSEEVSQLDSVDAIDDLLKIGRTYAKANVDVAAQFGAEFLKA